MGQIKARSYTKLAKGDFETLPNFRYELRKFLRFSEEASKQNGITPLQYQLLLQIKGYPGREWATIGELAERLQSHHHGVVSLVSRCEELELVKRVANQDDRRFVEVHLSPKGEALVRQIANLHREELIRSRGILEVPLFQASQSES